MKVILVLFVLAIVPALCQASENDNAPSLQKPTLAERRKAHRERWAKMSPEERAAEIAKRKAEKAARKAADRKSMIDRIKAAKDACPGCYRVVQEEDGKFVGLTKEQHDKWLETHTLERPTKDLKAIRAAKAARAEKKRPKFKRPPGATPIRPRHRRKSKIHING